MNNASVTYGTLCHKRRVWRMPHTFAAPCRQAATGYNAAPAACYKILLLSINTTLSRSRHLLYSRFLRLISPYILYLSDGSFHGFTVITLDNCTLVFFNNNATATRANATYNAEHQQPAAYTRLPTYERQPPTTASITRNRRASLEQPLCRLNRDKAAIYLGS